MFQDAINTLLETEQTANNMLQNARLHAEEQIEDAKCHGHAKVDEAAARAETEVTSFMRTVQQQAQESASGLVSNMENKKAAIGARAETTMHKAAALIVERIVTDG